MLTLREVENAIQEYESVKNPNAGICSKLADLYIVRSNLMGDTGYAQASAPIMSAKLEVSSDFLRAVKGKEESAWDIIDDLMDTLKVAYPRVYESVMRKIGNL